MDPRSAWALGEFRDAPMEIRILDDSRNPSLEEDLVGQLGSQSKPAKKAALARRIAYQGERLIGLLVVSFEDGSAGDALQDRWLKFGRNLNVELEITTEAAAAAGSAFNAEEPSLWRDYEGHENARDRGVLTRSNRVLSLDQDTPAMSVGPGKLGYVLDVEAQVPVEFLGQVVVLEAFVSPTSVGQTQGADAGATPGVNSTDRAGTGQGAGIRRGGAGGDFASRLDGLFALSRIAPVRLPVKRCVFPLRVVQPISVTSRSSPPSSSLAEATPSASSADGAPFGRCLIAIELRNEHPVARVTVHDVEAHVDATARFGERVSTLEFSAPGKAGRDGAAALARRGISGAALAEGSAASLEISQDLILTDDTVAPQGLEISIEQPPLTGSSSAGDLSRLFRASWVAKLPLPLTLAPGEVQGFVLAISPRTEPLPPRRSGGRFESPVSFVWTLDSDRTGDDGCGGASGDVISRPGSAPALPRPQFRPTTSVHLVQWQTQPRARDEVLVRVKGQPRVKLNRVFEVSLRVRNLAPGARDLVVMFTEDAAYPGQLSFESNAPEKSGVGAGVTIEAGDEGESGATRDVSPAISPNRLTRGGGGVNGDFDCGSIFYNGGGKPHPVSRPSGDRVLDVFPSSAGTSLGDLLPVDAAVPLGLLERGAERGTTVRLAAARSGLARLSSLRLRDTLTGAVYAPAHPYEVFVEN